MAGEAAKPHPHLQALSREVERTSRRVAGLDELVRGVAEQVTRLASAGDPEREAVRPRGWLQPPDRAQAKADLLDLGEWLAQVYLKYPGADLPQCWAFHPAAIEELLTLRGAHVEAFTGRTAAWARVADWHDRLRPGVVKRLRESIGSCDPTLHTPDGRRAVSTTRTPMARHLAAIADAYSATGEPPQPTQQQLSEAAEHDYSHRSRA